jgi:hypothetical protein
VYCVGAKFALRLLIDDQKEQRNGVNQELRHRANEEESFISNSVTGNETRINDMHMTLKRKTDISHEGYCNSTRDQKRKKKAEFALKLR